MNLVHPHVTNTDNTVNSIPSVDVKGSFKIKISFWQQTSSRVSCKHRQARQTDCSIPLIIRVESSNQSAWLVCVYTIP